MPWSEYRIIGKKGEGTFSEVLKAEAIATGQQVAIKCMKNRFESIEQVNRLREIQALRRLCPHPNIVQLIEVFDRPTGRLALVFELLDRNIYELIKGRKHALPEEKLQWYMYQLLKAMEHMHQHGIFHRDIKPENVLVVDDRLKLADFGSCRGVYSEQPFTEYRAPECLLTNGYYSHTMDMWGIGCVFFEIIALYPLFPGNNELDQINRIHNIMGTPPSEVMDKIRKNGAHIKVDFPKKEGTGIRKLMPNVSEECIDLINSLLRYNPDERLTAAEAIRHPYFRGMREKERAMELLAKPEVPYGLPSVPQNAAAASSSRTAAAAQVPDVERLKLPGIPIGSTSGSAAVSAVAHKNSGNASPTILSPRQQQQQLAQGGSSSPTPAVTKPSKLPGGAASIYKEASEEVAAMQQQHHQQHHLHQHHISLPHAVHNTAATHPHIHSKLAPMSLPPEVDDGSDEYRITTFKLQTTGSGKLETSSTSSNGGSNALSPLRRSTNKQSIIQQELARKKPHALPTAANGGGVSSNSSTPVTGGLAPLTKQPRQQRRNKGDRSDRDRLEALIKGVNGGGGGGVGVGGATGGGGGGGPSGLTSVGSMSSLPTPLRSSNILNTKQPLVSAHIPTNSSSTMASSSVGGSALQASTFVSAALRPPVGGGGGGSGSKLPKI